MSVGINIKLIRKEKGLSIKDIVEKSGIAKSNYCSIENESVSPTANTLMKIANALNVAVDEFFKDKGQIDYIDSLSDVEAIELYKTIQENDILKKIITKTKDLDPKKIRKILKMIDIMEE